MQNIIKLIAAVHELPCPRTFSPTQFENPVL